MIPASLALRALLPFGMAGALGLAWLRAKSGGNDDQQAWRDTSLDDWRAGRAREHDAAREQRLVERGSRAAETTDDRDETESRLG